MHYLTSRNGTGKAVELLSLSIELEHIRETFHSSSSTHHTYPTPLLHYSTFCNDFLRRRNDTETIEPHRI